MKELISVVFGMLLGTFAAFMSFPTVKPMIDRALGLQSRPVKCQVIIPKQPQTFEALQKRTD